MRRAEFDAWNAAGLDLVPCPPHALPAMAIGTSGDLTLTLSYSFPSRCAQAASRRA